VGVRHVLFHYSLVRRCTGDGPPDKRQLAALYVPRIETRGLARRIVTEAFALAGIQVEYGWFPWKRAYLYAQKGKWDGSLGWIQFPERTNDFYFSGPVFSGEMVFFHLKTYGFDWATMADLKGIQIGATIGYFAYSKTFLQAEKNGDINVTRVSSDIQIFRKLLFGGIQIFPSNKVVGYDILYRKFKPETASLVTHHSTPVQRPHYHLILSKTNPENEELVNLFNRGLNRLKASGRYDQYVIDAMPGKY